MLVIVMLGVQFFMIPSAPTSTVSSSMAQTSVEDRIHLPGDYFTENAGQLRNEDVLFYSSSGGMQVGFAERSVLIKIVEDPPPSSDLLPHGMSSMDVEGMRRGVLIRITFQGANPVQPQGRYELPHRSNFFLGNDPSKWQTDVRSYREIVYENLYEAIDLVYHMGPDGLKYDFIVHPGGDPALVRMAYEGLESLDVNPESLVMRTETGEVRDEGIVATAGDDSVRCEFARRGSHVAGFDCAEWDPAHLLVIDPLVYGTFLGGVNGVDRGSALVVDSGGNVYVTGITASPLFPTTPGAYDLDLNGTEDVFVAKLNAAGDELMYATYLGGSETDDAASLVVDASRNAYLTGLTDSHDFPVVGAYDGALNGTRDAFLAELDSTGAVLLYSTYFGGSNRDEGVSLALGPGNMMYVTGWTSSMDFPVTSGAHDTSFDGPDDAFVVAFDALGALVHATYLGGSGGERAFSVRVGGGNVYVVGWTGSDDFPTPGGLDDQLDGMDDAYLARFDATWTLAYATYLGGSLRESGPCAVALDPAENVYITGVTESADFPGALNTLNGTTDAFIVKIDAMGTAIAYARFLGGGNRDAGASVSVDAAGMAYVTGVTSSADFPVTGDALDATLNGTGDAFVTRVTASGTSLLFSTYLGGDAYDQGESIALDAAGNAYVTGNTKSVNFPVTPGAFDTSPPQETDGFVVKLSPQTPPDLPDLMLAPADISFDPSGQVPEGTSVVTYAVVHNVGTQDASQVRVRFYDGSPSESNRIDGDQILPFIPESGGTATAIVVWLAVPSGIHTLCIVADADSEILESNETNNMACAPIEVIGPPPRPPTNLSAVLSGKDSQNVTLTWDSSLDDGGGSSNVVAYDIYRNTSFDSQGRGYVLYDSVPNGTSIHVDVLAGEGDPSDYFYHVCAVGNTSLSSCTIIQAGKFTRPLSKGLNLVSIPLIQSNESIETILQTVEYDKAWYYDSLSKEWKWYMKYKGYRRGLLSINHTMGIWVNVTENSNLTVAGIVPAQTTIHLHEGWNLVSFPSFNSSHTVADLKVEVGATRVEGYDLAPPYYLRVLVDADVLLAGEAYWVKAEADIDWIVEVS